MFVFMNRKGHVFLSARPLVWLRFVVDVFILSISQALDSSVDNLYL